MPPSKPCLVFLHGFLGAKEDWEELCTTLSPFASCIAFDLPGHGSASPITPHYLEVVHEQIQSLCSFPPVLVGYSMGGRLALQLAQRYAYPHAILLSAHVGITDEAQREARYVHDLEWIAKLRSTDMHAFLQEWYEQPLFASLKKRPALLECIVQRRSVQNPERMAEVLSTLSIGLHPPIHSFPKRALFLYGEWDTKYKALYAELPKEVVVRGVPDSGHVLHLENPQRCAEYILQQEYI